MIEIQPVSGPVDARVRVPGSKSLTQRALVAAALAQGDSALVGPLASEDTRYTMDALALLGVEVDDSDPDRWLVRGSGGALRCPDRDIYLGNNGTATRFLASVAALARGRVRITGSKRMAQRPIEPLLSALRGWGVEARSIEGTGCPPVEIVSQGLEGGPTVLPEGRSSQYVSSLLLVAPYARKRAELRVEGEVLSRPYVEMTLAVMADFGIRVEAAPSLGYFRIPQGAYEGREYQVEGDASGASYFFAAAAITGGRVTVENVPVPSLQGDAQLVPLLARMGCEVRRLGGGITVRGGPLTAIEADMSAMPDVAPTLAVVAAFAEGVTVIDNIAHLRIKECDRIAVVAQGLRAMGCQVEEEEGRMTIHGRAGGQGLAGACIDPHDDHRMAMCFAIAGLRIPGMRIQDEACVAKSFPDFWERLAGLYGAGDRGERPVDS